MVLRFQIAIVALVSVASYAHGATDWFSKMALSAEEFSVEEIADDAYFISDENEKYAALLVDSSKWLSNSKAVVETDDAVEWQLLGFSTRAKERTELISETRNRRILKDEQFEFVLNETYVVAKDRSFMMVSVSELRDEHKLTKLRDRITSAFKAKEKSPTAMIEILQQIFRTAEAQEVRRTAPQVRGSQPDPRCANSGIPVNFRRRVGEQVIPLSQLNLASMACARGIGNLLKSQGRGLVQSLVSNLPLVYVITNPSALTDRNMRRLAGQAIVTNAQESIEMVRRFADWYAANKGNIIRAIRQSIGDDACLTTEKRTEYLCRALTIVAEVGLGGAAGARLTTLARSYRGAPSRPPSAQAAAPAIVQRALSRSVGNRYILYDARGVRQSIDTIQPGESFQAVMLPGNRQVALLRGGQRNGGHQYLAQVATRNSQFPRYEAAEMPSSGNIRFNRGSDGRWTTEVGGRHMSGDFPGRALTLAQHALASGVRPTLVTGGRLPGWTRPSGQ